MKNTTLKTIAAAVFIFATITNANAVDFEGTEVNGGGVTAVVHNSLNSQYMEQPTFAKIFGYDHGSPEILRYEAKDYRGNNLRLSIGKEFIDSNIELMEKFQRWAKMATERGDRIEKEIGIVDAYKVTPFSHQNKYDFYTAAKSSHYLIIAGGSDGWLGWKGDGDSTPFDNEGAAAPKTFPMMLNEENVVKLIARLREFQNSEIHITDDSDYK
jgi:hypothetical protein